MQNKPHFFFLETGAPKRGGGGGGGRNLGKIPKKSRFFFLTASLREMEYFESLSSGAASFAVYTLYPPKYDQLALTLVGKKSSLALFPETGLYAGRLSPQLSLFDSN